MAHAAAGSLRRRGRPSRPRRAPTRRAEPPRPRPPPPRARRPRPDRGRPRGGARRRQSQARSGDGHRPDADVPAADHRADPICPATTKSKPATSHSPSEAARRSPTTPIKGGGDVNVMTWNITGPIAPLESNTAWQEINQQVGATINLVNNVSNSDYRTKLDHRRGGRRSAGHHLHPQLHRAARARPFAQFPDFLERSAADLTPYLSGDAVKEFPNLAAIPTRAWKSVTYKNKIFGVPVALPAGSRHGALGAPGHARRRRACAVRKALTSSKRCSRR